MYTKTILHFLFDYLLNLKCHDEKNCIISNLNLNNIIMLLYLTTKTLVSLVFNLLSNISVSISSTLPINTNNIILILYKNQEYIPTLLGKIKFKHYSKTGRIHKYIKVINCILNTNWTFQ
jgi:hypothetical protein